ncbi:MAG: hypothetical protein ACYCPN_02950 [Thermoplasmata archaeon]
MSEPPLPSGSPNPSVETLKQIQREEEIWADRIQKARADAAAAIERLQNETEAVLHAARQEIERERERQLQAARTASAAEAEKIRADGERAAAAAARGGHRAADRRAEILAAVLGDLSA